MDDKTLTRQAAAYARDASRHHDAAAKALLALAWDRRREGFSFSREDIYGEALAICVDMSDKCAASARTRLADIIGDAYDTIDEDTAWNAVYDDDTQARFDMAGSHLLSLLDVWIGVAVAQGWSQQQTLEAMRRYRNNPYASPEWDGIPRVLLRWGRGYDKDIAKQLAKIGQDVIISGTRFAEWTDAAAKGATYYIRRRGSTYDCPDCDALCGYPIPIAEPFDFVHSRCMCYAEYHYEPLIP